MKAEQSPAPRSGAGGADCFAREARAGEEMTLLGEDDNEDPPGPYPHVSKCLLIIYMYIYI